MARMISLHEMKHIQGRVTVAEYDRLKRAAGAADMTLQEAIRVAVKKWSWETLGEDPWDKLVGMIDDGPVDIGNVDDIYLED